ncbi:hypothetical protein KEH51_19640 [[Brevibacterium] frigoritolerans]|uniref:Uncharacterized protein n=1 Tax=Peribacillus frigoritolerans TaxID=450367 RepID=A0A941FRM3_9BACI|nr:hypothetical protein [Peribacillus frigoritolerans]
MERVCDTPAGIASLRGDPTGASAPRADRPRKASAYVPINVKICTSKKM